MNLLLKLIFYIHAYIFYFVDIPVKAPQNTIMSNSIATSQINQSRNAYPAHINPGNLMISNLNLQSMQQSQLQHMLTSQTSPTITTYDATRGLTYLTPQKQPLIALQAARIQQVVGNPTAYLIGTPIQQQQQQMIQTAQPVNATPLGSLPNPITIDDNNTMDIDPPVTNVNHQSLGHSLVTQVQKKDVNLNRNAQPLSQNTKK
jgi:hypothetical protein